MPNPVAGEEGNLTRQERNLRKRAIKSAGKTVKRVAREKGKQTAGGMTTSRMATRKVSVNGDATKDGQALSSCSENDDLHVIFDEWAKKHGKKYSSKKEREEKFNIFCASKELVEEHNSLNPGSTLLLNWFADLHVRCGFVPSHVLMSDKSVDCMGTNEESAELKEAEGQDVLSCSENDRLLRVMFDEWGKEIGKTYRSEREREERFQIFCASKKLVDEHNSHNSVNYGSKLELLWSSDLEVQCGAVDVDYTGTCEERSEELKEAEEDLDHLSCELHILFDKWQEKYGIKYSCEEERKERFEFFCATKKHIDYLNSVSDGSRYGLNENSDRQIWPGALSFGPEEDDDAVPKVENEESKEARLVFDQWALDQGKKYRNKREREKRFWIFLDSKKHVDACKRMHPSFWTDGYPPWMDLMPFEIEKTQRMVHSKYDVCSHAKVGV